MPDKESIGSELTSRGSVRSSHSSLNMPIVFVERNENVKAFDSPGFRIDLG